MSSILEKNQALYKKSIREFLNPENSTEPSVIVVSFEITKGFSNGAYGEGKVVISDCSKQIYLDLDIETEELYKKSKYKLEVLQKVISEALKELDIARLKFEEEDAYLKKKRKEEQEMREKEYREKKNKENKESLSKDASDDDIKQILDDIDDLNE